MKHSIFIASLLTTSLLGMEQGITEITLTNYQLDTSKDHYLHIVNKTGYTIDFFHEKKSPDILEYYNRKSPKGPHPLTCEVKTNESLKFPIFINKEYDKDNTKRSKVDFHFHIPMHPADKKTWALFTDRAGLKSGDVIEITYKKGDESSNLIISKKEDFSIRLYLPLCKENEK